MKTFELLNDELKYKEKGVYAPYYFRYLGYAKNLSAKPCQLRANGVFSLFTEPTPVILKNEWLAGNKKSLWVEKSQLELNYAKKITDHFSDRSFITNKDHYAPNYAHILKFGLQGMMEEIDASCEAYREDKDKLDTLNAMKHTLSGLKGMIQNHVLQAEKCKNNPNFDTEKLDFIIANCKGILQGKPQNFPQALQLIWFCHLAFFMEDRGAMALGRLDQYLYPFYQSDIQKVEELCYNTWIKEIFGGIYESEI